MTEVSGPTIQSERILSLDVLRGFAVLGILIMNIQHFSMVGGAYFNPTAYGDLTGLNYLVWLLSHLLADMKFMSIFSMLFGAGIVLMAERMEAGGGKPARIHYRRTAVLLFFGLAHAWLIWTGDILYSYAMCALLVYLFRNKQPKTLIILGVLSVGVASLLSLGSHELGVGPWILLGQPVQLLGQPLRCPGVGGCHHALLSEQGREPAIPIAGGYRADGSYQLRDANPHMYHPFLRAWVRPL